MSRFTCPEEFSDQKIIWRQLQSAADICAGKGEYGLANSLFALCAKIKNCVQATVPHRYVADNNCERYHVRT